MAGLHINLYDSNMAEPIQPVAHYSLYGELQHLTDLLHCEPIALRSRLHDWELKPHRHERLHQLLLVSSGAGVAWLADARVPLQPAALINVPRATTHAFVFEPGTNGLVLTLADAMLDELLGTQGQASVALSHAWVAPAAPEMAALGKQISSVYATASPARGLLLKGLVTALLGHAVNVQQHDPPLPSRRGDSALLRRFEAQLDAHFCQHWRVADYARTLTVTPTHLSRVVRQATGEPASQLIDARLVREARRLLAFTPMSVKAVAYTLGFADPAHFSRVFSRVVGVAPRAFRNTFTG